MQVLKDRVAEANGSYVKLMNIGSEIVDLHGQMVLLENYSALNYLGICLSIRAIYVCVSCIVVIICEC